MLKKTITYTDYDGMERTEDFWFNYSKAEVAKMELRQNGGMKRLLEKMQKERNNEKLVAFFDEFIVGAYGERSMDGRRFEKSKEMQEAFRQTEAYSELFLELLDTEKMAAFVNAVLPNAPEDHKAPQEPTDAVAGDGTVK